MKSLNGHFSIRLACWTGAVLLAASSATSCLAQEVIAGLDFLHTTPPTTVMAGGPEIPPIPPSFFGPGSDPFVGTAALGGQSSGQGNADTIVRRLNNTIGLNNPPPVMDTVPIEIVVLNLVSIQPITVTFNGGQNPQQWNVTVDLSTLPPPLGQMTVRKTHANGGTWDSVLPVQPRFTFTQVGNPGNIRTFDTGGVLPPIQLQSFGQPWSYTPPAGAPVVTAPGASTNFFPGVLPTGGPRQPFTFQSQQGAVTHTVEVASAASSVPTVGEWGLITLGGLVTLGGIFILRRRTAA